MSAVLQKYFTGNQSNHTDPNWTPIIIITEDWDELNEYKYINNLAIPLPPCIAINKWACVYLPKLKLRWKARALGVKIQDNEYIQVPGSWKTSSTREHFNERDKLDTDNDLYFYPELEDPDAQLAIACWNQPGLNVSASGLNGYALLPLTPRTACLTHSSLEMDKILQGKARSEDKAGSEGKARSASTEHCDFVVEYQHWSFNRQGVYLNRKYRPQVDWLDVPDPKARIIEPRYLVYKRGGLLVKLKVV